MRARGAALGAGLLAAAVSCRVGPDFARPAVPSTPTYVRGSSPTQTASADGRAQRFVIGAQVAADWWTLFGSRSIDDLVQSCLAGNADLDAARASVRRAEDELRAGYGVFFPQLDAHAGASDQRATPAQFGTPGKPVTFALYALSGTVSYTIDLWGGNRRQVEGLAAQVDASRATLGGTQVLLTANAITTVVARAAYADEIATTSAMIEVEQEQLRLAQVQVTAGTAAMSTALSIASQLAATQATIPPLEEKRDQADHLLAVLAGTPPSQPVQPIALDSIKLPTDLPLTVPAELVRRRPDVLVAEADLHAATAQIGVATAAMLPNLTLTGSIGGASNSLGSLLASNGLVDSIAGGLTQPLFHGGALYYQRKAAIDARDQALASYRSTVLAALEQVADVLRALQHDADAVVAQHAAVDAGKRALDLIQANYQSGIATYLQVIIADEQYLQARLGYIQASAQRLQDTVALYAALGGGWWRDGVSRAR
jgi:NodT family efflux transporter outer membrane factor (OMF) lipoprotein